MPRLLCLSLPWLGLLLLRFSLEQSDSSRTRKLCGRHLLNQIVKICGTTNWSQFEEKTPSTQLLSQALKMETLLPDQFESSQTTFPVWGRGTNPAVFTSASQEEAINNWVVQSLPEYQYEKVNFLPDKTREFSSSQGLYPYSHEMIEFEKKNTNKIKALSNSFWGNHPQRKRRGYSEKCCLKGCSKEDLIVACLPYINYKNLRKKEPQVVMGIYRQ